MAVAPRAVRVRRFRRSSPLATHRRARSRASDHTHTHALTLHTHTHKQSPSLSLSLSHTLTHTHAHSHHSLKHSIAPGCPVLQTGKCGYARIQCDRSFQWATLHSCQISIFLLCHPAHAGSGHTANASTRRSPGIPQTSQSHSPSPVSPERVFVSRSLCGFPHPIITYYVGFLLAFRTFGGKSHFPCINGLAGALRIRGPLPSRKSGSGSDYI